MPSPSGLVDLRSDTVTTPTPAMRRAMAEAEVGDDGYGEDPTVNRLQEEAAARLGKDAGLYVPSGTMANQLALHVLARPGSEVLCPAGAHVYRYEGAAAASNVGVQMRVVAEDAFAAAIDAAVTATEHHFPPLSAVVVENTYMPASGRALPIAEVTEVATAARAHGLGLHCDGARIWNAAVALDVPAAHLVAPADTVMFCVSKGLGAPVGSVLCGAADAIAAARAERGRLGGRMRQAGVIAAAGLVALGEMVDRLAEDHARARRVASLVADRFPGSVDPPAVATNIVCAAAAAFPPAFLDQLAAEGVLAGTIDPATVRFVTHKDVDDADLDRFEKALDAVAA
jgi:threonine aldolase